MSKKKSRRYDEEFKLGAVKLCEESEKTDSEVAEDLGIPLTTLSTWKKKYRKHKNKAFNKKKELSPEAEELKRLKKEMAIMKEERDILKKALAIFSSTDD